MNRRRLTALPTTLLLAAACTPGGDALEETPAPPYAELARVDLTDSPKNEVLANFYCRDLVSALVCDLLFDDPPPEKSTLKFSFETVFELGNPNSFAVPMVELLLAFKVFEGQRQSELAALCVSFCDPAAEDCEAKKPEEACLPPDKTVRSLEDFVPTVDDLVRVAEQAIDGTLDDNLSFRVIPGRSFLRCRPIGTTCEPCEASALSADAGLEETPEETGPAARETICCGDEPAVTLAAGCSLAENEGGEFCELCDGQVESRVRFDLGVDAITNILAEVAADAVDALSEGELPSFDIPYSVEGTLFFDVPVLGRFAIGFGPFSSTWSLD